MGSQFEELRIFEKPTKVERDVLKYDNYVVSFEVEKDSLTGVNIDYKKGLANYQRLPDLLGGEILFEHRTLNIEL